jgi:hypothetical protein
VRAVPNERKAEGGRDASSGENTVTDKDHWTRFSPVTLFFRSFFVLVRQAGRWFGRAMPVRRRLRQGLTEKRETADLYPFRG